MMGQSATSASLKIIKKLDEWLIQQMILLPWYLDRLDKCLTNWKAEDLLILVAKLDMNQQCTLDALGRVLTLYSALMIHIWSPVSSSWLPSEESHRLTGTRLANGHEDD